MVENLKSRLANFLLTGSIKLLRRNAIRLLVRFVMYILPYFLVSSVFNPDINYYTWQFFSQASISSVLYSLINSEVLGYRKVGIAGITVISIVYLVGKLGYWLW